MLSLVSADLRRNWAGALAVIILIALATSLGVAINLQERALRLGSARAAAAFDLVIGAPGSETQLVLSAVFLQTAPLPLLNGEVLAALRKDPRVAYAAPVGFGDFAGSVPLVGTTTELISALGGVRDGRILSALNEAVIGADTDFAIDQDIKPLHGEVQGPGRVHAGVTFRVVGRLGPTGTAWDRAVLVPIKSVWRVHGLADHGHTSPEQPHGGIEGNSVDFDETRLSDPEMPGVPAIVVKPRSIADAYKLRQEYRADRSIAVFPGEVLTRLYATLGNARTILAIVAVGAQILVGSAVVLMATIHVFQRRRQIGALRAFGAPRFVVLITLWLESFLLLAVGLLVGHLAGFAAAKIASHALASSGGFALPVAFDASDGVAFVAMLVIGALAGLAPACVILAQSPAQALRA